MRIMGLPHGHITLKSVPLAVTLWEDSVLQAELVGRDPPTDIGILRIPSRGR